MSEVLLFENARIITCEHGQAPIENGFVLVEDRFIRQVGPENQTPAIADMVRINCQGHTLLPGLIDAHVHIGAFAPDLVEILRQYSTSYRIIRALGMMRGMLDQGFTTVRDCGGADAGFRRAQSEGRIPGPRLNVCGPAISQTGGHADFRLGTEVFSPLQLEGGLCSVVADGETRCRKASREIIRQGADFLKIMGSGGAASPTDKVDSVQFSAREIRAICDEAGNAGTYVASHCYSDRAIIQSVENGVRTIEHGNLMTRDGAEAISRNQAYLVPTLATYYEYARRGESLNLPPANIEKIKFVEKQGLESVGLAMAAGVKIGLGTDCLGPMQDSMARALILQSEVMGPMGALVAATRTNAEILRMDALLGTLVSGKLADMIAVKADPLEDISLFKDYSQNISLIVQDGRIYKNLLG